MVGIMGPPPGLMMGTPGIPGGGRWVPGVAAESGMGTETAGSVWGSPPGGGGGRGADVDDGGTPGPGITVGMGVFRVKGVNCCG